MATDVKQRISSHEQRIAFHASWDVYRTIAFALDDQHVRASFDGERIELMSPGSNHECFRLAIEHLIVAMAIVLRIPCKGMGSTRWIRPDASRGVEGDSTYYLSADKIAIAKTRPKDDADLPSPDLAVEIDMSPSLIDRPGIYSALEVPEVWRFDGETLWIERLGPDGTYHDVSESEWFGVRPEEVVQLIKMSLDSEDDIDFSIQAQNWAREVLVPRRNAS